jgi:phosphatidylserine/phosphatidylglycerophosphate/cardiolipin synthase-like enzyme
MMPPFAGMIQALAAAEARRVAIRMIYSEYQQQSVLELLSEAGMAIDHDHVRIQNNVHNNGILIDGHLTVVSSQNWSGAGVLHNRDAGLIIDNAAINAHYLPRFDYDWTTFATATPSTSS